MRLIRELTDVARALKAFDEASASDPRSAVPPSVGLFPPTGVREVDVVANMFAVTLRVLTQHIERLRALVPQRREMPPTAQQATVLFCGLDDRTANVLAEEPKSAMETLSRYHALMAAVVKRHGGAFLPLGGASFLAVFGMEPGTEGGHALRACRSGMEMLAALDQLNAYQTRSRKPPVRCAIGIHTGDVLTGTMALDREPIFAVVGATVSLAMKVQGLAQGEIRPLFLSGATAQETGGAVKVESRRGITVRVGDVVLPIFSIMQSPPHVNYREMLDGMFGVVPVSREPEGGAEAHRS